MLDVAKEGVSIAGNAIASGTTIVVEKTKDAASTVWEKGKSIKVAQLLLIRIWQYRSEEYSVGY